MTQYSIYVATIKPLEDVACLAANIRHAESHIQDRLVISSAPEKSVAEAMNWCLDDCKTPVIVFVDDDIRDFPRLFADKLVDTLESNPRHAMVSAKLMTQGRQFMGGVPLDKPTGLTEARWLPSACIAMYKTDMRFDENLLAMDDADYCYQLKHRDPHCLLVVDNYVKVTHLLEQKWNTGNRWDEARKQFEAKWGRKLE